MTRRQVVKELWKYWLAAVVCLAYFAFVALHVPSDPVSSPGSGAVPAVTGTAGTSTH